MESIKDEKTKNDWIQSANKKKKISSLELNEIEFNLKLNVDPFVGLDILLLFSSILCLLDSADNPLEA